MLPQDPTALMHAVSVSVPSAAETSTVAIVAANAPTLLQIGSGTLLSVADRSFVVTAGHAIRKAAKKVLSTLGISGGDDKKFIATPETWLVSPDHSENHSTDVFDVAIDSLSIDQVLKLNGASFVRIADVSFARDLRQNYFVIIGYPNIWSTVSISDHELVELRPLQYGTDAYSGSKAGLEDYDERFHLLLNARPGGLLDQSGKAVRFRTRTGFPADLPQDLQGISGCSVWSIGDPRKVPTEWSPSGSRLVGVQTGFFSGCGAIKATRWNAVTTLLHSACPDLRPVLELYERI